MKRLAVFALCAMLVGTSGTSGVYAAGQAEQPAAEAELATETELTEETEGTEQAAEDVTGTEEPKTTELLEETEEVESETELPTETEKVESETELPAETELTEETEGTEQATENKLKKDTKVKGAGLQAKTVTAVSGCTAAELQELLDENKDGEYQLTVIIPAGTYNLTKSLYVYANTTIQADANAKLVKQSGYGAMIEAKLVADDGGYDGNHDITIDGGIWDSTPTMNQETGTETFRFIHCNNITVKNATLCNVPEGSHLIVFAGVQNATVTNCTFYGYNNWKSAEDPKEAIQLDVVHSEVQVPTQQDVKWDDLPCDNITISGCNFYEFSRGIGSHTAVAGRLHSNVTITGNTFRDLSESAVRLYNYKDSVVSGNTIQNVVEGILVYNYIAGADENSYFTPLDGNIGTLPTDYNVQISNNVVQNISDASGVWGDGIRVIGGPDRPLYGVDITGNSISSTSRYGIFATTAPDLTVNGNNQITGTASDAILLTEGTDNAQISGNNISAGEAGIAANNSDGLSAWGNTITANEHGISLLDSENAAIGQASAGNTITAGENGIALSRQGNGSGCTAGSVLYNNIQSAGENGIFVYKSAKVTVEGNTIAAAGENGILASTDCTEVKIASNQVNTAKKNGISVTSQSKYAEVTGNTVLGYGTGNVSGNRYGIMILKSGGSSSVNAKVQGNSVTGTGKKTGRNGIHINGSAYTTVSGNTVNKADGAGIYVYQSKNCKVGVGSKDYNTIQSPKEAGIHVTATCDGTTVNYNKISSAKGDGIAVYKSKKVTVNRNSVSASKNGIYVTSSSTSSKITNNTVNSAGKNGIQLSGKSKASTISGNTIKKYSTAISNGSGIYVYQAGGNSAKATTKVSKNKITGTGKSKKKHGIRVSTAAYTKVESNTVNTPAGAGIYVYKSKNCTINKNKITKAKAQGIYVTTACDKVKITSNTVSKAASSGIATYKAPKATISSNKVTALKKQKGIWVSTSNSTQIKSNTVTGATKKNAVLVTSSKSCKTLKNKIK